MRPDQLTVDRLVSDACTEVLGRNFSVPVEGEQNTRAKPETFFSFIQQCGEGIRAERVTRRLGPTIFRSYYHNRGVTVRITSVLGAGMVACALCACGGGASTSSSLTPNVGAGVPEVQPGMPAPFDPSSDSLATLDVTPLAALHSTDAGPLSSTMRPEAALRSPQSTIQAGDPGFYVGLGVKNAVTAIYAIVSAYTPSQFSIPFPPSGGTTAPVSSVERVFGPEIEPLASCLTAGLVMANFGPGGTQRNGPGNPLQSLVGAYNAFRVLDLCNTVSTPAGPVPTFYLTPIDGSFTTRYVRPNESGLPSLVTEVFSSNRDAYTNPHAAWYAILWNFETKRWNVMNTSRGNQAAPGFAGDVLSYAAPGNLPELCPTLPPLIVQDIHVLDPSTRRFVEPGFGGENLTNPIGPGTIDPAGGGAPNSTACFKPDATGPASFSFAFLPGKRWADWELKAAPAPEPAPTK